jgi:hypothetical protein
MAIDASPRRSNHMTDHLRRFLLRFVLSRIRDHSARRSAAYFPHARSPAADPQRKGHRPPAATHSLPQGPTRRRGGRHGGPAAIGVTSGVGPRRGRGASPTARPRPTPRCRPRGLPPGRAAEWSRSEGGGFGNALSLWDSHGRTDETGRPGKDSRPVRPFRSSATVGCLRSSHRRADRDCRWREMPILKLSLHAVDEGSCRAGDNLNDGAPCPPQEFRKTTP